MFFSSRRRHTRLQGDWSSDVCSSDLIRTCWNCQCILRHRTASRSSLYEGHPDPVVAGICRLHPVHRHRYPTAQTIHLVMDNLSSHTQKARTAPFGEEGGGALGDRFTVHSPPVHGSWLNQAELEIGLFSKQCLGKRPISSSA